MSCKNNERRTTSQTTSRKNNYMLLPPHDKMFSDTRDYQLFQANSQSVLTSAFTPRHTLTHLKASAFLFMGSISHRDDGNNKDSQNEGLFPPWIIGDEQLESTRFFESSRCELDSPRDVREVKMGSILESSLMKYLGDDIIGEDDTLRRQTA